MTTAFLIAAPTSGSGKTTVARQLMRLYTERGRRVQPFKCGPDYIDTKFHTAVCGRPSVNLDPFMASPEQLRQLYRHYSQDADVCIVEGMMGLFDGYDRDRGSCAEVASVLGLPVVLVVDARSAAYSLAPLLKGFKGFRSDVSIVGVIFNRVGSERHQRMLRQVCADVVLHCLGCLPRQKELETGERYLGLDFSGLSTKRPSPTEDGNGQTQGQDQRQTQGNEVYTPLSLRRGVGGEALIAFTAESFSFIYQQTIDLLRRVYGSVGFFNPETDVPQLDRCSLLYLPGGYPEKHLQALADNGACRSAISSYAAAGGRIIAECGGMMYLCRSIVSDDGRWPMCGVLPYDITARQTDRKLSLGYRQFTLDGRQYRGHEFHYTQFMPPLPPSACQVSNAVGEPVGTPVIKQGNVLASYTHLYLNETNIY